MILWATELARDTLLRRLNLLPQYDTVVVRADLKNKIWQDRAFAKLRGWGGRVFAYVRAPVHYNYKAVVSSEPYEWIVKDLMERAGAAPLRHISGQVMLHPSGWDAYTLPWRVPLRRHAEITASLAYDPDAYTGLLIDGLTTWQIYAADAQNAQWGPELGYNFALIARKQYLSLRTWVRFLRVLMPKALLIGNGSWEPMYVGLRSRGWGMRWEYEDPKAPLVERSKWVGLLAGTMDERVTHPYYHEGHPMQQGPRISQTLDMHIRCAKAWLAAGKEYWLGGGADLSAFPLGVQRIG